MSAILLNFLQNTYHSVFVLIVLLIFSSLYNLQENNVSKIPKKLEAISKTNYTATNFNPKIYDSYYQNCQSLVSNLPTSKLEQLEKNFAVHPQSQILSDSSCWFYKYWRNESTLIFLKKILL